MYLVLATYMYVCSTNKLFLPSTNRLDTLHCHLLPLLLLLTTRVTIRGGVIVVLLLGSLSPLLLQSSLLALLEEVVKWVRLCLGVDSLHELLAVGVSADLRGSR